MIVLSKNRPAQLDLLLNSIDIQVPHLFRQIKVLWDATDPAYEQGYSLCEQEHDRCSFLRETDFRTQVLELIRGSDAPYVCFLCDDDIFYRRLPLADDHNEVLTDTQVLCFSLRLGVNTTKCYPLHRKQAVPVSKSAGGIRKWFWRMGDGDFGYPGSLDGHIFRRHHILFFLVKDEFSRPNEMEDVLNQQCRESRLPLMSSFTHSVLLGSPNNRVNSTHLTNRYGDKHPFSERDLNDRYLKGERIKLENLVFGSVGAAHSEIRLEVT